MGDGLRKFFNPPGKSLPWRMFWVGLIVRVAYITLAHTFRMRAMGDHFQFGWEMGRIARALATGYGYSDPFNGHSGPTAWAPPLYPLLLAAVFKVFGVYSLKSGWVILVLNSVSSAGTVGAVVEIGRRCFGGKVALWSGWLWALHPAAMQYAVKWVWDMSLTAFLFAWVLVLALRIRGVGTDADAEKQIPFGNDNKGATGQWLMFGVLWGLIALSNSSLLLFLPACALWMVWGSRKRWVWNAVLAAVCCAALLAPWVVRNSLVFHAFVPLRSNLGAELYETALPENEGYARGTTVSLVESSPDFQRYKRLGEVEYSREQGVRAMELFRVDEKLAVEWFFKRIYFFWASVPHGSDVSPVGEAFRVGNFAFISLGGWLGLGLALRRKVPGAWLFFWAFLLAPVVYYVVTVQARFRHPLEPVITVLVVYLFQSAETGNRQRQNSGILAAPE